MWLVLVLLAIFIPVHTLSVLDLGPEDLLFQVKSEKSWFSFLLKVIIRDDFLQGIIETTSINSLSFIFTIPVHFIYSAIKVSKYYFVVISLVLFLLLPLAIFFLVLYLKGAQTQRTLLLVSTSVIPSRPRWSRINNPVRKKWEKGGAQPIVSYMVYLIVVDMSFS